MHVCLFYLNKKSLVRNGFALAGLVEHKEEREEDLDALHARDHVLHLGRHARGDALGEGVQLVEVGALGAVVVDDPVVAQLAAVIEVELGVEAFALIGAIEAVKNEKKGRITVSSSCVIVVCMCGFVFTLSL